MLFVIFQICSFKVVYYIMEKKEKQEPRKEKYNG